MPIPSFEEVGTVLRGWPSHFGILFMEATTLIDQNSHDGMRCGPDPGDRKLQLHAEQLSVSRQKRQGETVRIRTVTHQHDWLVDEELTHERVDVERVPIDREVTTVPPVREEGDITIISVVEERVFVELRLVLKEEVRIRRVRVTEHHQETVVVRDQDAVITRTVPGTPTGQADCGTGETVSTQFAQE
jgi:uncharacterized protein (TIGR02271 family)